LIEPRGSTGNVALLVGMAGRSHWSLSVEPIAGRAAFLFDAACRLHARPTWLGHVWRAAADGGVGNPAPSTETTAGSMSWRIGAGVLRVAGEPSTDGAGLAGCEWQDAECRIGAVIPAGRYPVTARWRFIVEYTE